MINASASVMFSLCFTLAGETEMIAALFCCYGLAQCLEILGWRITGQPSDLKSPCNSIDLLVSAKQGNGRRGKIVGSFVLFTLLISELAADCKKILALGKADSNRGMSFKVQWRALHPPSQNHFEDLSMMLSKPGPVRHHYLQ